MNKTVKSYLAILVIIIVTVLAGCKKKEEVPVITTTAISNVTATTATSGGNITDEGSSTVITRGVCWSTGATPSITDSKTTDGAGAGSFSSNLTALNAVTNYYVRAYATNTAGTGYGMALSFKTFGQSPTPTAASATNIDTANATLNGSVNANYLSTVVTFEYGTTTSYGSTITATQSPVTGNTSTSVSADITGLTAGSIYHYRISAVNSLGTTNSNDITFTTLGQIPTVSTLSATNITTVAAQLNGSVNANALSSVVTFEYGTTTSYGNTVTATQSPVTGNSITNVSINISGLTAGMTYHFRIKAANSFGTTYGSDVTFTTAASGTVTDVDGNIYNTITIGTQVWMKENLKTTKYRNGDSIGTTTPATLDISGESTPKYQWAYDGNESNVATYGRLYTWYAITDSRNVCPSGWHVPTDAEWTTLFNYLTNNGYGYGGSGSNIAKSMAATSGWTTNTTAGTVGNDQASNNSSGFSALPGGYRLLNGAYDLIGGFGYWWSSTEYDSTVAWNRFMTYNYSDVLRNYPNKQSGFSVRCLRD
jgi:uncharacterized protein (TIGR02145 family)